MLAPKYRESDDSDYVPSGEERTVKGDNNKRKISKKSGRSYRSRTKKKPRPNRSPELCEDSSKDDNRPQSEWAFLPHEVLVNIFSFVVAAEGSALPSLSNIQRVCKHWNDAAQFAHLWTHLSFSPVLIKNELRFSRRFEEFEKYAAKYVKHTRSFRFLSLDKVGAKLINAASIYSEKMEFISIMNCGTLRNGNCLSNLISNHGVNIKRFSLKHSKIPLADFKVLLHGMGESLQELEVIFHPRFSFDPHKRFLNYSQLKNVAILKMDNVHPLWLDTIRDLRKLKILHIKHVNITVHDPMEFDWPDLLEIDFTVDVPDGRLTLQGSRTAKLLRISAKCPKLEKLCLRGWNVHIDLLYEELRFCEHIFHLDVTCFAGGFCQYTIGHLVSALSPSLKELHIDRFLSLEESLKQGSSYVSFWNCLHVLSMQSTNITSDTLLCYLRSSLTDLNVLNVCTCRSLPRGSKQLWSDIRALKALLEDLVTDDDE